ncbi:1-hydroxycarotenoid 3,4-desaturase CrtD [Fluviicola taffensis]|uniref:Phytoene desaturase n=1 Tax=Fluviicola taffensis (strain DSM 16823 / NCIMB 13979 / RW262) TaxID=755732 RepID=F2IB24_FLUTR|nr:1-hydroxycarotenoid 3,4-desaturase CrtD [Fluviicola taffensis]AEA42107.1 phytoene desaturase [Fluviicola taffensis DSM 16823]
MAKKAIIIGAGIAGIASAIRLTQKGYSVSIFESNGYAGGKLTTLQLGNYRFDAGPSLFTLPHLVDELFEVAGKDPRDYFNYQQLEMLCHYFYEDGTVLHAFADQEKLIKEVESKLNIDSKPLKEYLNHSEIIFERTRHSFLEKSLHKFSSYISLDILKTVTSMRKLNLFETMHEVNEKSLNHPKLVQLFDRFATYNGSNPYKAPGVLNSIPHLEFGIGSFFPTEGMHEILKACMKLAQELGVEFHFNEEVKTIQIKNRKVTGIETETGIHTAELILSNCDVKQTYKQLIPNQKAPEKTMNQEPSSSALIFYWGIQKSFPELDVHNILFSDDYKKEFNAIFDDSTVSDDPTVYIHISSKIVSEDAPIGSENWFIMVNVPSNQGQDWEKLRLKVRQLCIEKINRILKTDIESLIEEEDYLDPIRISERTNSFGGALYGASSNERMAAFFRHPNFSKVKGLYFAGGSVHPGGGIPLCLLSAKIATDLIPNA